MVRSMEYAWCSVSDPDSLASVDERVASALERIATALEARNAASMPIPVLYDVEDPASWAKLRDIAEAIQPRNYICACGRRYPSQDQMFACQHEGWRS